ncbi:MULTISPECIES: hypothetical protein [Pseudoalteromonas]|uniref:Uncharacterized protein n=1 Tax=Pseudoalteromonas haloplanktis TaxID=228 RepID=A0ABU1BC57_PSEHA|nr:MULTISPECIES: hypothetical protein [Pseudoalteromonas]MCF6145633.1 hypothetical protein [Pseudoalteromonas mariniglutinosa NCIMB 1770]MDQ9092108.1 hypothetical protein [Pseudoalteromonas haloplanktis]
MHTTLFYKIILIAMFMLVVLTQPISAGQHQVVFDPESSTQRVEFEQQITGNEFNDYLVSGNAGDILNVTLTPSNLSNNFNILPADSSQAVFIGSIEGHYVKHQLAKDGDYIVRVYLMRNAARRNESSNYKLTIIKHVDGNMPTKTMHPSWDRDGDGMNDCENDGSCDHTIDYTKARPQKGL